MLIILLCEFNSLESHIIAKKIVTFHHQSTGSEEVELNSNIMQLFNRKFDYYLFLRSFNISGVPLLLYS